MLQENLNNKVSDYIIEAIYTEQILSEYQENPLIESLPPILTEVEVIQFCSNFPNYDPKEKELDASYRFHCVQRVFQYFQPFVIHLELEQKISRCIRQGYISRNPFNKNEVKRRNESYKAIKEGRFLEKYEAPINRTATGFTIIGFSGIGKSTAIDKILSIYPKVIRHTDYKGKAYQHCQIPWLKLDCPFDGSLKGLCLSFFSRIDELLGTNYFSKYRPRANTIDTLLQHMVHIANLYSIGVLIIDEIQHLNSGKSGGSEKMLNFFVTLINTIGIPVIMIGTNKAVSILQSQFRQARRGSGQGDLVWNQMPKDETWELFLEGLWDYQWVKQYTPLNEEISEVLYEESQGIIDIAVKIFMISQLKAISNEQEKLSISLIRTVVKENLQLVRPMLEALKSGIPSEIAKYEDIQPIDMDVQIEKFKTSIDFRERIRIQKKIQENKRNSNSNSVKEEIILFLLTLDVDSKKSENIANKVLKDFGSTEGSITELKKAAMKYLLSDDVLKESPIIKEKQTNAKTKTGNILCELGSKAKKTGVSVYNMLLDNGYIKIKII